MTDTSRRGFFGFIAGAAALATAPKALLGSDVFDATVLPEMALGPQLMAITRKAFVPKVYVQIYQQHPMLSMMLRGEDPCD